MTKNTAPTPIDEEAVRRSARACPKPKCRRLGACRWTGDCLSPVAASGDANAQCHAEHNAIRARLLARIQDLAAGRSSLPDPWRRRTAPATGRKRLRRRISRPAGHTDESLRERAELKERIRRLTQQQQDAERKAEEEREAEAELEARQAAPSDIAGAPLAAPRDLPGPRIRPIGP